MKNSCVKGISLIISFSFFLASFAQDPEAALTALNKKLPPEKVYIHYDKEYYTSGETIWFKAYLYSNGLPSAVSHNLYLQLVNAAGEVVEKKIYPVAGATATGSIQLPDSLPAGSYYVRATTPSMLNHGEEFVYRRNIPVYNPGSGPVASKLDRRPISVQFFPEGGSLVDGIITVVGIKATDKWGYPATAAGIIKSNTGTVMTSFKTAADGIGKVQFKPTAGQSYFGEVEMDGKKYTYPLPAVQAGGVNLKVQDEKDGKLFQITRGETQKDKYPNVTLLAQLNNEVVYRNVIPFDDYLSVKGRLLTQGLPSGILHFTLFDATGNPIAERLSFVNNREQMLTPELLVLESSFAPGGTNQLQVKFPQGIKGVFSISVTDASLPELPDRENIYSRLLLTGDLKSHVYNPARYFENDADSTKRALDNFLLTQSWSRFQWNQIMKNELPAARHGDNYLRSISGIVTDEKTGDRIYGGILNLFLEGEDSATQNYNIPVNNAGKYVLDSILFYGNGRILYTYTEGKKPPKVNITVDRTKMDSIAALVPKSWSDIRMLTPGRDVTMNSWTPKPYVPKTVTTVTEAPKLEKEEEKKSEPKHVKDEANQKYADGVWKNNGRVIYEETMKVNGSMNALDYILLNISTVKIQGNRLVNIKNMSIGTGQHWDVGVFIDEANVSQSQAQTIQMRDVGMIKFYESGFVGVGTQFAGGGVAIYRKKDSAKKPLTGELPSVPYTGYSLYKDFSKVYATAGAKPANRTLLYWNPTVFVDSINNSVNIPFDNNATGKKFKVVVEGFDASGKLLYFEKIIE